MGTGEAIEVVFAVSYSQYNNMICSVEVLWMIHSLIVVLLDNNGFLTWRDCM